MFKRILVGYAGDQAGRDAALLASRLARLCGSAVTVVFPYHPLLAAVPGDVAEQRARDELGELLGPDDPLPREARFHWSNSSWPVHALHELAPYDSCDLIVFGAAPGLLGHHRTSLAERMVHGAPSAVAIAPAGYAQHEQPAADAEQAEIRRIGVGFADTEEGRAAIATALELAGKTGERAHLIAASGLSGALASYAGLSPALPQVEQEMYEEMSRSVVRVCDELAPHGSIAYEVHRGEPSRVLVAATRELDLLVLGSRGYGPFRHVLLGSISAETVRTAECPVLVLPRSFVHEQAPEATVAAHAHS